MNINDITSTCAMINRLGRSEQLQFKALPVIQWEFADKSDFFRAEYALKLALDPILAMMVHDQAAKREMYSQGVVEFDYHGVTFRLICKAIAADVKRVLK